MRPYRRNVVQSVMADLLMEAVADDEAPAVRQRSMDHLFAAELIAEAGESEVFEEAVHSL